MGSAEAMSAPILTVSWLLIRTRYVHPPGRSARRPEGTSIKVAIVTSFPEDPQAPRGGVQAVSVALVRALGALGDLEVHVVTTSCECDSFSISQWQGATIHRLAWAGGRVLTHALGPGAQQICQYLQKLQPDVVHSHDVFGLMVKSLPLPRVFTPHGVIYLDTRLGGGPGALIRSWLWRWAETSAWANQPHIVAISPHVRQGLQGRVSGKIHVIANPVAPEFFKVRHCPRNGTIFSAAAISPLKNTLGLLEAFEMLVADGRDIYLHLAGAGECEYEARVRLFIRSHGLQDRVSLLGNIPPHQVRKELAAASVFALISLQESAPMCVAEAMAVGVPVLASNICGLPYMVRDGKTGFLVPPRDTRLIANRLNELLQDGTRRDSMGEHARQVAWEAYAPQRVAQQTRDVYEEAINGSKGNVDWGLRIAE